MENQAHLSAAMWSGLISFNQWWKKGVGSSTYRSNGQHFLINVLLYVDISPHYLLGVLSPPGCDIWFPRPGHNGSNSRPSDAELQKPVRLYNIEKDPEERNEVSAQFPAVVDRLLARLHHHQQSAVPINFPDDDPKCDPGPAGAWGPWTWKALFTGSIRRLIWSLF